MKKQTTVPGLKSRGSNVNYYPKLRRIRQQPRHKIRQLLRSFIPPNPSEMSAKNSSKKLT